MASPASADPLLLLRAALSANTTITLLHIAPTDDDAPPSLANATEVYTLPDCTHVAFPSPSSPSSPPPLFPKGTKTRYLAAVDGDAFDLQTLLFAFLQREAPVGEYMRQAREMGTGFVSVTERRNIVEWLSGKAPLEGPEGRIRSLPGMAVGAKRAAEEEEARESGGAGAGGDGGDGAPAGKKARYAPQKDDLAKVKTLLALMDGPIHAIGTGNEIKAEKMGGAYRNRETVLRGDRTNTFESARQLAAPRLKLAREDAVRAGAGSAAAAAAQAGGKPNKKKQLNPIIMISPSSTALITMYNVKKFLEESIFKQSDEARLEEGGAGGKAEDFVIVEHARTTSSISSSLAGQTTGEGKKQRFFVVDGVEALSKFGGNGGLDEAWDRVVCVMTTGQEWQFRPYKWTEPKELFHHVKGVFVQWTTEAPNMKVRSWNVRELRIDQTKRHIDKSTVADFWRDLEAWMSMHKPTLLAQ